MMRDQIILAEKVRTHSVCFPSYGSTSINVLRTDLIHPVISGNKWYKLKEYLKDAICLNKKIILTFGGAYSNHIVATAAAAKHHGFQSVGIIRGEKAATLSHTLQFATEDGMRLYFNSRELYKTKTIPDEVFSDHAEQDIYIVGEGGYGKKGVEGAKAILDQANTSQYSHLIAATGTGTTLAGMIEASAPEQQVIGISVFKNNFSLQQQIRNLISIENQNRFTLVHDYHFGGYAKYNTMLTDFMNVWYKKTQIPSDFVYTGKLFFAVHDLIQHNFFSEGSKILVIHSGGLQGNQSLPKGTLIF